MVGNVETAVRTFGLGLALCLVPAVSWAQSIAGQVTDTTGGVLPGVTVEASSPALIERARVAVSDGQGRYLVTELRPGIYSVTFSLPGFRTVVREGIELTAGFTATVSIQMSVGAVEETVTVSGDSPVVDVQSVRTQAVMTRDVIDAVPTGRTVEAMGILIPGTGNLVGGGNAYGVGVGGSGSMQQSPLVYRGNSRTVQQVDGFRMSIGTNTSYSGDYFNNGMIQEVQYVTSGDAAESPGGGLRINMVPKDGGNTFAGSVFGGFTYGAWAQQNLDQRLRDRGLETSADIHRIWDVNPSFGGPLKRDRLWFQLTYRNWGVQKTVPGSFSEITGEPALDRGHINSTVLRLTWQINEKNKFATQYTRPPKWRDSWGLSAAVSPEAAAIRDDPMIYNATNKWTATVSNRVLVEAGLGLYTQQYTTWYRPDQVTSPGQTVRYFPVTNTPFDPYFPNTDLTTGFQRGSYSGGHVLNLNHNRDWVASASYVTGSHSLKVGLEVLDVQNRQSSEYRGDMTIRWRNGRPDSVFLRATPLYAVEEVVDLGLYAQDVWTFRRITVNGGIRFERFTGYVPEQWSPPGTWVGARLTPEVKDAPKWTDVSPRVGLSWDMFGDARTALKFNVGRYIDPTMTSFTSGLNPMRKIVGSTTVRWLGDTNGNLIPDPNELGPVGNRNFGTVVQDVAFDPETVEGSGSREYHWDYGVTLQHELLSGLALNGSVYYRKYYNLLATDNLAIGPANFDEFTVVSPSNSRLPEGGGQTITGLYAITDAARPLSNNYRTFAESFGDHSVTYRGADFSVNWRARNGGLLGGGVDYGQQYINQCYVIDSPGQLRFCDRKEDPSGGAIRGGLQVKLLGALPLPGGWQFSGTFQSVRGPEIQATWTTRDANGTLRFVNGTRANLGATPTVSIDLIEPGTQFDDRFNQLDLRGTRVFNLGGNTRVKVMLDLYNALNGNAVLRRTDTYGPVWGRPINVQEGRLFQLSGQLDF